MNRNLWTMVATSALFALAFAVYELALPLFLDDHDLELETIGWVMAAGAAANFLIIIYGGRLADLLGRRGVFSAAHVACALTSFVTPLAPHAVAQTLLKSLQGAGASIRGIVRSVLVYETVGLERFSRVFPRLVGLEVCFQTFGFLCVGLVGTGPEAVLSYRGLFAIGGTAMALAGLVFWTGFREPPAPELPARGRLSLRGVFAPDLHPKLYLIVASGLLFSIGLATSHTLWALYFRKQLAGPWSADLAAFNTWLARAWPGAADAGPAGEGGSAFALIGLLAIAHRLCLGVPMFLVSPLIRSRFKAFYIGCLALGGAMTLMVGVVDWAGGGFLPVALIWPLHDVAGASIWFPIQERFIQQYSRPEQRGTQIAKVRALTSLGLVIGAGLAGALMSIDLALPFAVGGWLILMASLLLLPL